MPDNSQPARVIRTTHTLDVDSVDMATGFRIEVWREDSYLSDRTVLTSWHTRIINLASACNHKRVTQSTTSEVVRQPNALEVAANYGPTIEV